MAEGTSAVHSAADIEAEPNTAMREHLRLDNIEGHLEACEGLIAEIIRNL